MGKLSFAVDEPVAVTKRLAVRRGTAQGGRSTFPCRSTAPIGGSGGPLTQSALHGRDYQQKPSKASA
jgi:hypothetical protein